MVTYDVFDEEYDEDIEWALSVFHSRPEYTESNFVDACQILIDSGVWLTMESIGETCLFLMENGNLFLPEEDQEIPSTGMVILGTPRKNVFN